MLHKYPAGDCCCAKGLWQRRAGQEKMGRKQVLAVFCPFWSQRCSMLTKADLCVSNVMRENSPSSNSRGAVPGCLQPWLFAARGCFHPWVFSAPGCFHPWVFSAPGCFQPLVFSPLVFSGSLHPRGWPGHSKDQVPEVTNPTDPELLLCALCTLQTSLYFHGIPHHFWD